MLTLLATTLTLLQAKHVEIAWNTGASGTWNLSSDGINVYALSTLGQLRVYSGQDGSRLFDKKLGDTGSSIATLPDGTCYAVADGKLIKLNSSLAIEWASDTKVQFPKMGTAIAVSSNGTIAVNTVRGVQIFGKDGKSDGLTTMTGMGPGPGAPIFLSDTKLVFMGGTLSAESIPDHKSLWVSKTGGGEAPVLLDGALYVSSNETIAKACVLRVSSVDGSIVWKTPTTTINHAPAVSRDAVLVPGDLGMWGLSPQDGHVGWRNGVHTASRALVVGTNQAAVISRSKGNSQAYVSIVDMLTGNILSQAEVTGGFSPIFAENPFIPVGEKAVAGFYKERIFLARIQ